MRTLKSILLAGAVLLATPVFFSSCQEDAPQIDYEMKVTVVNDFSKVVDAINNGTLKNEQAIAQLAAAIDKMNTDQQTKLQAIKDVLNSVNSTLDAKLAAIEAAMTAQTLSLEGKLALIEEAMKAQTLSIEQKYDAIVAVIKGLPDYTEKLEAIQKAISALPDYTAKLDAIEKALTSQTLKLKDKLAAIEAVMKNQSIMLNDRLVALEKAIKAMPNYTEQLEAIKTAISALPDYSSKLEAIEKALNSQTLELAEKLGFIKAALEDQTIAMEAKMDLIKNVLADQNATLETKLGAIEAAMKEQTIELSDKLALIEQTIKDQTTSFENKMDLLAQAIESLPDYTEKLEAVKTAFENINPNSQLEALNALLDKYGENFTNKLSSVSGWLMEIGYGNGKLDQIVKAIESLGGYGGKLDAINTQMTALLQALESGNMSDKEAMAEVAKKIKELELNAGVGVPKETMEYVDLGLPSGIKWAKCDLGGTSPEKYGDRYAWGETWTKWNDKYYYFTDIVEGQYTKYDSRDKRFFLEKEDDAAYLRLGEGWRTPTWNEVQELIDNCTVTASTLNGWPGVMFVSKINNNYIFFGYSTKGVVDGRRWTSAVVESNPTMAKCLYFDRDDKTGKIVVKRDDIERKLQRPIRPVYVKRSAKE